MAYNDKRTPSVIDKEAELHNAGIKDRYAMLKLRDKEDQQLAEMMRNSGPYNAQAYVETPTKSKEAPAPTYEAGSAATYAHTSTASNLFTAERLDRTLERSLPVGAPTVAPTEPTVSAETETNEEFSFSLTSVAKRAIAVFTSVSILMMTMVCVNTRIINDREEQIMALNASNENTRRAIVELEEQIAYESSEDVIRLWAESEGLVK